jgi:hypothetical protein
VNISAEITGTSEVKVRLELTMRFRLLIPYE